MYCRNCGKWIDYDAEVCTDCKETDEFFSDKTASAQPSVAATPSVAQPLVGSRKEGLGKAITSTALGAFASLFALIVLSVIEASLELYYYEDFYSDYAVAASLSAGMGFCLVMTIALSIPSLILGILSIVTFKRASSAGRVKPIPTLILGIAGLACAVESLMLAFLSLSALAL